MDSLRLFLNKLCRLRVQCAGAVEAAHSVPSSCTPMTACHFTDQRLPCLALLLAHSMLPNPPCRAGGLVFSLKKNNRLGPGPAFTVRLEVDYKKVWGYKFDVSSPLLAPAPCEIA